MTDQENPRKLESEIAAIRNSCEEAAIDLGIEVVAPHFLAIEDGNQVEFIALFPSFGSLKGTLIVHFDDWEKKGPIATAQGFNISGFHPSSYSKFNRKQFLEVFNELGWQGTKWTRPKWCYG